MPGFTTGRAPDIWATSLRGRARYRAYARRHADEALGGEVVRVLMLLSGALAGTLHVLSGPDHVVAIAPYADGKSARGHVLGATWGLGHGGGALLWLGLAWLLRGSVRGERISEFAEVCVGLSLILVGALALRPRAHATHAATHQSRTRAAFGFGVLHGTAGASHVLLALPTLGLAPGDALGYAAGYFGSAVVVMSCVGGMLSQLGSRAGDPRLWSRACGTLAMLVGAYWLVDSLRSVS